jgi:hypothetical protein
MSTAGRGRRLRRGRGRRRGWPARPLARAAAQWRQGAEQAALGARAAGWQSVAAPRARQAACPDAPAPRTPLRAAAAASRAAAGTRAAQWRSPRAPRARWPRRRPRPSWSTAGAGRARGRARVQGAAAPVWLARGAPRSRPDLAPRGPRRREAARRRRRRLADELQRPRGKAQAQSRRRQRRQQRQLQRRQRQWQAVRAAVARRSGPAAALCCNGACQPAPAPAPRRLGQPWSCPDAAAGSVATQATGAGGARCSRGRSLLWAAGADPRQRRQRRQRQWQWQRQWQRRNDGDSSEAPAQAVGRSCGPAPPPRSPRPRRPLPLPAPSHRSKPVGDAIMEIAAFEKFLADKIKVRMGWMGGAHGTQGACAGGRLGRRGSLPGVWARAAARGGVAHDAPGALDPCRRRSTARRACWARPSRCPATSPRSP